MTDNMRTFFKSLTITLLCIAVLIVLCVIGVVGLLAYRQYTAKGNFFIWEEASILLQEFDPLSDSRSTDDDTVAATTITTTVPTQPTVSQDIVPDEQPTIDVKSIMIDQYGTASQEPFVSCLGADLQTYPTEIYGVVSSADIDVDRDGVTETIILRVAQSENTDEPEIVADIYQQAEEPLLLTSQVVDTLFYSEASHLYVFYSDVLSSYCLVTEARSSGAYTGIDESSAMVYTISKAAIVEYDHWGIVPMVGINDDIEAELKAIGAPFAMYGASFDTRRDDVFYQPLCYVEHEVFGDTAAYITRNHRLCIKDSLETEVAPTAETLSFGDIPADYIFCSGAGAWRTFLTLNDDGTFVGEYTDSNMGEIGDGYPKGTQYRCSFSGSFSTPEKIDDYTYSMELESITIDHTIGETYIEEGIQYIYTEPYGLENAKELYIYLPGKPISELPDGFLMWAHLDTTVTSVIPADTYGIYNIDDEEAFISTVR